MRMRVLLIGDTADNNYTLKKFANKAKIHLINFPRKQDALTTTLEDGIEFFDSLLISRQVEKICSIKNDFDICLVIGWAAARVAYLSGLNYIMYFVGNDIMTPPFLKNPTEEYLKTPVSNHGFLERIFYKKILDSAIACITVNSHYYNQLKKFRKDAIRVDRIFVDTELFNQDVSPQKIRKEKFTFLSPQRIGIEKGFDIIWQALKMCKAEFEILQVNWFIERTEEEKEFNKKLIENIPSQIKLIPLIPRNKLGKYYVAIDAILGQVRVGTQGAIERDAAMCKKPVICYNDPKKTMIIDENEINPPFLPTSKDPKELAELIDKIVTSKEFRDDLAKKQFKYVRELSDPKKVTEEWEKIFEMMIQKHTTINRNGSRFKLKIENIFANILERLVYTRKFKEKNIQGWGTEEYNRLVK